MENKGILVYCIAKELDESISEIAGLDGINKLYAVENQELYAIVSDVDLEEYGEENMAEKGEDIEWLKEKATIFMDVILKINSLASIIPMKFLTIFTSEERVKGIISDNIDQFLHNFEKIKNREELSVKIYCDDKTYKEKVMGEEISKFEKTLIGKPKGAAFFLKKKFDSELDDKIQNKICDMANRFADGISKFAVEMKSNNILAKEITGITVPMILNGAYLVNNDQSAEFTAAIDEQKGEYEDNGFIIELSGPWPPFSFYD
ncbi:MAG: GvpL/GvpF family gas vesicle protein [Anaerocolumna sp.]